MLIILLIYTAVSLLAVVTTYYDAVKEYGDLPVSQVLIFMREGIAIALDFIWWIYILRALGVLTVEYAGVVLPLTTTEGVAVFALALALAVSVLILYALGRLWSAFAASVVLSLILVNHLDVRLLALLVGIFIGLALGGYAVFKSELRSPPGEGEG